MGGNNIHIMSVATAQ